MKNNLKFCILTFLAASFLCSAADAGGLAFGLPSAVKDKVKDLKREIDKHAAATGATVSFAATAPAFVTAAAASSSQITISWQDIFSAEAGFKLERKAGGSSTFSEIAAVAANVQSYTDTSLAPDTAYYYRIRAYRSDGTYSTYSLNVMAFTLPAAGSTTRWSSVSAGDYHSLGIKADGTLWAWGYNLSGELGTGDTTNRWGPTKIGTNTNWMMVAAGPGCGHSLGLQRDGTLWAWGINGNGELGLGDFADRGVPTRVGTDSDWAMIAAGWCTSAAIKRDGRLYVWGYNAPAIITGAVGQLGLPTADKVKTPTQLGTASNWASVTADHDEMAGVKTDGELWAWASDMYAMLQCPVDDTSCIMDSYPVRVETSANWKSVSAGLGFVQATRQDGTLWTWGINSLGQLGLGDTAERTYPVRVGADSDWAQVSSGFEDTLAIKADGTLWGWGSNSFDALGLGDGLQHDLPTKVGIASTWANVAIGDNYALAIKTDGTLWSWGMNTYGALGVGDDTNRTTPVPVP